MRVLTRHFRYTNKKKLIGVLDQEPEFKAKIHLQRRNDTGTDIHLLDEDSSSITVNPVGFYNALNHGAGDYFTPYEPNSSTV